MTITALRKDQTMRVWKMKMAAGMEVQLCIWLQVTERLLAFKLEGLTGIRNISYKTKDVMVKFLD